MPLTIPPFSLLSAINAANQSTRVLGTVEEIEKSRLTVDFLAAAVTPGAEIINTMGWLI